MSVREPRVRLKRRVRGVRHDEARAVQGFVLAEQRVGGEAVQRVVPLQSRRERVSVAGDEQVVGAVAVDHVGPFEFLIDADRVEQRRQEFAFSGVVAGGAGDADGAVELLLNGVTATRRRVLRNGRVPLEQDIGIAGLGVLEVPRVAERVDHSP